LKTISKDPVICIPNVMECDINKKIILLYLQDEDTKWLYVAVKIEDFIGFIGWFGCSVSWSIPAYWKIKNSLIELISEPYSNQYSSFEKDIYILDSLEELEIKLSEMPCEISCVLRDTILYYGNRIWIKEIDLNETTIRST